MTNYELDLIKEVFRQRAHIFVCNKAAVYGDEKVVLGDDMKIQKVESVKNKFHSNKNQVLEFFFLWFFFYFWTWSEKLIVQIYHSFDICTH